jgi:putative FmdB family regulatory protein
MPIYEYRCQACNKRTSVFVRSITSPVRAACEHCGSKKLTRLISRVVVHRGASSLDDDSAFEDVDENDPRQMARLMRQMGEEAGEEMGPEFDEMVSRLEAGEDPEAVMSSMDDGGMAGDSADDDF